MVLSQPRGAIPAVEAHRQRIDAGPKRRHQALRAAFGGLQFGDPLVGQPQRHHGALMVFVEPGLALVQRADAALHGFELCLGGLRAGRGLLDHLGEPRHPLVDRLDAGAHGLHLAGQPGQALAAVGLGPHRGQVSALGVGGHPLGLAEHTTRGVQPAPGLRQLGQQVFLAGGELVGLGLQLVGVAAAGRQRLGL